MKNKSHKTLESLIQEAPSGFEIANECDSLKALLIEKNISYGDSALEPCRIFSRSNSEEQLLVRIDDKLNRIQKGSEYVGDDTIKDLAGYLILLLVHRRTKSKLETS